MRKRTKIFLLFGVVFALIASVATLFFVKKIRSAEYAYEQGLQARACGDGDAMLRWMSIAGSRGDVRAQMFLATGFEIGAFGGIKDEKLAASWYETASRAGNPVAQFNYGTFCWTGRGGVPEDRTQAIFWWGKAATGGIPSAKTNLGVCFRDGLAVEKDLNKARNLFIEAAAENHLQAQYHLGLLFENEGNRKRALYWLEKAASAGHEQARKRFEELTGTHL